MAEKDPAKGYLARFATTVASMVTGAPQKKTKDVTEKLVGWTVFALAEHAANIAELPDKLTEVQYLSPIEDV